MLALVFLGGCLGGLARYAVTQAWPADALGFPWATLAVNDSGCFALAVLLVCLAGREQRWQRFLGTGVLGAWTTFSAVVASTDQLIDHHRPLLGLAYLAASTITGLLSALAGLVLARRVVR